MPSLFGDPVVHLELRTGNLAGACAFYRRLFGWRAETIRVGSESYVALGWGSPIEVGVVEGSVNPPVWLPYAEVDDIQRTAGRARLLGGSVPLEPTEGPTGWHGVVSSPDTAEIGLWQPKR